ncbi:MAG: amino acid racemase [Roseovarius sp.]|nr:amino acid racemase [Roseovarius sp.]
MRPVGILGGMGPEATIQLMRNVLQAVDARDDSDHVPLLVHQNPQVPSRIKSLIEGRGENPKPVLTAMARHLERAGAKALAMPCNTAHHYANAIEAAVDIPFLNMIDITAQSLAMSGSGNIGMLASPATRMTGVFDRAFKSHGFSPVWVEDEARLLDMIRLIKSGKTAGLEKKLGEQARNLVELGAEHILVACTELSLLSGNLTLQVPVTDSLDCLAESIVGFAKGNGISIWSDPKTKSR